MKKKSNQFILMLLGLILFLCMPFQQASVNAAIDKESSVEYLALGDSLAFGYTPENEPGEGYADFIAQKLQSIHPASKYNKGFSYPGYTSEDVLQDIQNNVTREVIGSGFTNDSADIKDSITNADIITISAGANDILKHIAIDSETGAMDVNQAQILSEVKNVGANYKAILEEIYQLNPNVKIYVMGYYNPFPYFDEAYQSTLYTLLGLLNDSILNSLTATNASLVPTGEAIANNFQIYLPNPENIHLSQEGYKVVADLFWEEMNEPTFSDVNEDWAIEYVEKAAAMGLVKGKDGKFKPYDELTRVQAASIFTRALHLETTKTAPFTDLKGIAAETQEEINAAYDAGLIRGYEDGKVFKPYNKITRAQMALMMQRALVYGDKDITSSENAPFSDIHGYDEETIDAISLIYHLGIVKGKDGKYMPEDATSRQQAAKMFVNTMEVFEKAN